MVEPARVEVPEDSPSRDTGRGASLGDRAARGTGITLIVQGSRTVLQFGSMVVLARLLVPEDFGLVAMVTAVIGIAQLVRDFGLSVAAIQSTTLSTEERDNLFWANTGIGLACTVVVIACTPLIVGIYDEPRLTPVVLSLASVFAVSGFITQYKASLARDMRFKAIGLTDVVAQVLSTGVAIALAALGFGLWALVAQQVTNAVSTAVLSVVLARWWPRLPHRGTSIRRFLRFGAGVFGTQGISYVASNVDNVAIGAVWGATPLGLYSRGYQLMMMPLSQINAPMTQVALPVLSRVQEDDDVFSSYLQKSQLVACYVTATLFAVAVGLAEPVVLVLFGPVWVGVIPIFAVLAVGGVFRSVAQIAYWAYLARGKSGALFRQRMVTGSLTIAMVLGGLPWGPVGVATGATAANLFSWVIAVWHVGRVTGIDTRPLLVTAVRTIAIIGAPCGAVAHLGVFFPVAAMLQIVIGCAFAGAYVAGAYLVFPSIRKDLDLTLSFGRRAFGRKRGQLAKG